jgi:hypothetical protein
MTSQTVTNVTPRQQACSPTMRVTKSLLGYGVVAGAVFETAVLIQGLTRRGFSIAHDEASLLSNGPLGWIQIAAFAVSGLATMAFAIGARRALAGRTGGTWGSSADRQLRRRAGRRGNAARRPGRRLRSRRARGPGHAAELARRRAPHLGGYRVHRAYRSVAGPRRTGLGQ